MVRISDARMSGTAFGTVILHTSPESAVGGALAIVQNGGISNAVERVYNGMTNNRYDRTRCRGTESQSMRER